MNPPAASVDVLRKIRGLVEKAEATEYGPEQKALMAKASALMAKYRVDQAMLDDARPLDRSKLIEKSVSLGSGSYVNGRLMLLSGIGRQMGVKVLTKTTWDGRVGILYGFEIDIEGVELLYTSLLMQMTEAMRSQTVPSRTATVSFRRSFQFGFATAVEDRLRIANSDAADADSGAKVDDAHSEGRSVALVLADRQALVEEFVTERVGKVGHHRIGSANQQSGFTAGGEAGRKADLNDRQAVKAAKRALSA